MLLGLLVPTAGPIRVLGEEILRHRSRVLPRHEFLLALYRPAASRLTVRQNLLVFADLYHHRRA